MVQTTLNDEDILAAIRERKLAAVGNRAFRGAFELREEAGREVHAFEVGKTNGAGERSNRFPRPQKSSTISASRGHCEAPNRLRRAINF